MLMWSVVHLPTSQVKRRTHVTSHRSHVTGHTSQVTRQPMMHAPLALIRIAAPVMLLPSHFLNGSSSCSLVLVGDTSTLCHMSHICA